MRVSSITTAIALLVAGASALDKPVHVEVTHQVPCSIKTKRGDKIQAHYRGTLDADGSEFDASYNRGVPLSFTLGSGQVIKGWDMGLLDMCIGEKRHLTIQPEAGYGNRGMGPIPANSVLIFETELVSINGVTEDSGAEDRAEDEL